MKICAVCGTKFAEDVNEDYAYCPYCEDHMSVLIVEELDTDTIDSSHYGITLFSVLDLKKQRDIIMASFGSDSEKLEKLNKYIDKYFERLA